MPERQADPPGPIERRSSVRDAIRARLHLDLGTREAEYRLASLPGDIAQARFVVAATTLAILAANLGDLWLASFSAESVGRLWLFGWQGTLTLALLLVLSRVTTPAMLDGLLLAWVLSYSLVALYFRSLALPVLNEATIALLALGAYTVLPQRLLFRVLPSLLLTVGDLWVTHVVRAPATASPFATVLAYLFIHVTGGWVAASHEVDRRLRYLALRGEHEARQGLERLVNTDALTEALTRRRWLQLAEAELSRYGRHGRPFAILMADLDFFKRVNDHHGHLVGDAVLRRFAELLHHERRRFDLVGRLGGEEFGVLLPETDLEAAREVAERIVVACRGASVPAPLGDVHITCSIGVAVACPDDATISAILTRADAAMYAAKAAGRDQVAVMDVAGGPPPPGPP